MIEGINKNEPVPEEILSGIEHVFDFDKKGDLDNRDNIALSVILNARDDGFSDQKILNFSKNPKWKELASAIIKIIEVDKANQKKKYESIGHRKYDDSNYKPSYNILDLRS